MQDSIGVDKRTITCYECYQMCKWMRGTVCTAMSYIRTDLQQALEKRKKKHLEARVDEEITNAFLLDISDVIKI